MQFPEFIVDEFEQPILPIPTVELDWEAYCNEFEQVHGEPVLYNNRLLFADGWQYSATDLLGPEWPPPEDHMELRRLQRVYWQHRLRLLETACRQVHNTWQTLLETQQSRSVPLQQKHRYKSRTKEGEVVHVVKVEDLDLGILGGQAAEFRNQITECKEELNKLKERTDEHVQREH